MPQLCTLLVPALAAAQTCSSESGPPVPPPSALLIEDMSLWEPGLGGPAGPDRVELAARGLPYSDAALVVDAFLARHSVWSVDSEPYSDGDPLVWVLKRAAEPEVQVLLKLDAVQRPTPPGCEENISMSMWNQGWGSSFQHIVYGLSLGLHLHKPFQLFFEEPWPYAQMRRPGTEERGSVCPAADTSCYFLGLSSCQAGKLSPREEGKWGMRVGDARSEAAIKEMAGGMAEKWFDETLFRYASRPRHWLRRALFEQRRASGAVGRPCAVMHVRRGDSILYKPWKRKYHAIDEYVDVARRDLDQQNIRTILLMTDSSAAVEEARSRFPSYEWRSVDKPRFKGAEGGLQQHIPEGGEIEVVAMLHELTVAKQCRLWIGGHSGYGNLLWRSMCNPEPGTWDCPTRVELPRDDPGFTAVD